MRRTVESDETEVAADRLRGFVGQIEASDDRIASENRHKSDIFKQAKKDGFNVKALRKVIAARRMDEVDRSKLDADFDLYMMHLEGVAHAHVEIIEEFDPETGEILEDDSTSASFARHPADHGRDGTSVSAEQSRGVGGGVGPTAPERAGTSPAGVEGDEDRQPIQQSTAARTDVRDNSTEGEPAPAVLDPVAATTPPAAGRSPVDTNSTASPIGEKADTPESDTLGKVAGRTEPEGASQGAKPGMATVPATEGGSGNPQPSSVVPGRQPGCLNPDTCAGTWRKRCASCERAFMAVAAGGQAIVHQGQVA